MINFNSSICKANFAVSLFHKHIEYFVLEMKIMTTGAHPPSVRTTWYGDHDNRRYGHRKVRKAKVYRSITNLKKIDKLPFFVPTINWIIQWTVLLYALPKNISYGFFIHLNSVWNNAQIIIWFPAPKFSRTLPCSMRFLSLFHPGSQFSEFLHGVRHMLHYTIDSLFHHLVRHPD